MIRLFIVWLFVLQHAYAQQQVLSKVFELQDIKSGNSMKKLPHDSISIFVFLATDCPICQKYMSRLEEVIHEFAGTPTRFYAVFSGYSNRDSVRLFKETFGSTWYFVLDKKLRFARKLKAQVTPEVMVFDRENTMQYRGAIDNWFFELGRYRPVTDEYFLKDAVRALLRNQKPAITETVPIGCFIQY